jgi:hypothetical protein
LHAANSIGVPHKNLPDEHRRAQGARRLSIANSLPKDTGSPEPVSFDRYASNQGRGQLGGDSRQSSLRTRQARSSKPNQLLSSLSSWSTCSGTTRRAHQRTRTALPMTPPGVAPCSRRGRLRLLLGTHSPTTAFEVPGLTRPGAGDQPGGRSGSCVSHTLCTLGLVASRG